MCFSHVSPLSADAERAIRDRFGATETARLESIKHPDRRLEYLTSRRLMRDALAELFDPGAQGWQFEERRGQPPSIAELGPRYHINLSHSKGLICFAIADAPVGIDIEACERRRDYARLARLFMTEAERARLSNSADPSTFFYRCWCIKEAFYKAQPKDRQASLHFSGIEVADLEHDAGWHLTEGRVDDHYLVATTRQQIRGTDCHYYFEDEPWQRPFAPSSGKLPSGE